MNNMRFLADMGVAHSVVTWLKSHEYDAVHLKDEGLQRLPDSEILQKAIEESRILLTFDLDFGEIIAHSAGRNASVIVFRLQNTRAHNVIQRLETVLAESQNALERGAIISVEEDCHRVRYLPLQLKK